MPRTLRVFTTAQDEVLGPAVLGMGHTAYPNAHTWGRVVTKWGGHQTQFGGNMRRISLAGASAAFAGALLIIGGSAIGSASPAHAAPQRAGVQQAPQAVAEELPSTTTTLPLFGAPLTIDVTSAPGGAISSVTVDPSDGLTASTVKPNKVRFLNEDGTATVQVSARNGGQKVQARAGQLSDILGPGSWSGDLWGQNAPTTVNFVIAATPAGGPDITNVQVSDPNAEISPVSYKDHGDEHRARVTIRFSNGVDQRWLGISAAVGSHDGESRATLSVGLSDATGERLPTEDVVGAHSWTGTLCDGSVAQVNYTVNADRSVSDVSANPDTATIKAGWHGAFVAFSDHEVVKIRVKGSDDGTTLRIDADEWFRCDNADPTVNTPIDESHDNHDGHDGHDGDGRGDHGGWPGWPGDGGHDGQSGTGGWGGWGGHDGHDGATNG